MFGFIKKWIPRSTSGNLSAFTTDFTEQAKQSKLDPFSGREEEIERVIHILMRRTKNNPLLLGQPGVGKTAIVEGLALKIAQGDVPAPISQKRILALDLPSLLAETKYRGEMESRVKQLLQELEATHGTSILFIDEIHMLGQISGIEGSLNIGDILKPALSRGEINVIGATTWEEYERYIHPHKTLDRRFQPIVIDEPTPKEALAMLLHVRSVYEQFHGVKISDDAVAAAVQLSKEKIKHRYLPDKAIDVIDEASVKVSIEYASKKHSIPLGVIHEASKNKTGEVTKKDVEEIIHQWTQK